jgi:hypothetical protein
MCSIEVECTSERMFSVWALDMYVGACTEHAINLVTGEDYSVKDFTPINPQSTIDGMEPLEWLEAMTMG